ncbi:hypothetical protein A0H81_06482 [Grifola frondosa]|uniref:BTB domain-containing protein n=1 Tax=Grifola frondosa TaxID=5627 RepID=A0A1C7M9T4_GRIFR|nr:hypothetical protein A0H81_06482 [Grifola frondosa]
MILENLLRLVYPVADPTLVDIHDVRETLEAAIKYEMEEAIKTITGLLAGLRTEFPMEMYAIACRLQLEDVARLSAQEVRRQQKQHGLGEEAEELTAGAYHRLLRYCQLSDRVIKPFSFCHPVRAGEGATSTATPVASVPYPFNMGSADVVLRSLDGVKFHVHRVFLC